MMVGEALQIVYNPKNTCFIVMELLYLKLLKCFDLHNTSRIVT